LKRLFRRFVTNQLHGLRNSALRSTSLLPNGLLIVLFALQITSCGKEPMAPEAQKASLPQSQRLVSMEAHESPSDGTIVIDFETPDLGSDFSRVIDPYVDAVSEVVFDVLPDTIPHASGGGSYDATLGLIKNRWHFPSICTLPESDNQKLVSGVRELLGASGECIQATFPKELPRHSLISVQFEALWWAYGVIWLYDENLNLTGYVKELLDPPYLSCGVPPILDGRKVVSVESSGRVKYVLMDVWWKAVSNFVFSLDNFSFRPGGDYTLDIRPGSCPNVLNAKSNGVFTASLLGSDLADVLQIDLSTLRLDGVAPLRVQGVDIAGTPSEVDCACPPMGPDGHHDLLLQFKTQEVLSARAGQEFSNPPKLYLTGNLWDGTPFGASDCVRFVGDSTAGRLSDGEPMPRDSGGNDS